MTPNEHLTLWVQGNSIHNLEHNQCCPDFSCCAPKLRWPKERREQFKLASDDVREMMLVQSLYSAMDETQFTPQDHAAITMSIRDLHE